MSIEPPTSLSCIGDKVITARYAQRRADSNWCRRGPLAWSSPESPPWSPFASKLPLDQHRSFVVEDGLHSGRLGLLDDAMPVISPVPEHGIEGCGRIGLQRGEHLGANRLVVWVGLHRCSFNFGPLHLSGRFSGGHAR